MKLATVFNVRGSQVHVRPPLSSSRVRVSSFPRTLTFSSTTKHANPLSVSRALSFDIQEGTRRPFLELPPSSWGNHFLSASVNESEVEALAKQIDQLKAKVGGMLMSPTGETKEKICLIYQLISLGLSYHFENEIEEILKDAFGEIEEMTADEDDLYTISVMFWVFRTYRHHMSSDVFERFKGDDGKFKKCLVNDAKGMLSLYEAAHLGTTTEDILDEAVDFTLDHLEGLAKGASPHLSRLIQNALFLPHHQNIPILFSREFISFYAKEKDHNETLLKFAKVNFNYLQLLYKQELKTLAKWWKDLDLRSKLPHYFRDRIVECYIFGIGVFFEAQCSQGRAAVAKFIKLFTILDDTYDRYASLDEAISLGDCVERWDPEAMDNLPPYLKIVFRLTLDIFGEYEREARLEGRSYSIHEMIEEFKRFIRANVAFRKWEDSGELPSFDEYMEVGDVEVGIYITTASSFIGMGNMAEKEAYEWLKSRPKLIDAASTKTRLMNDMTGFKDDMGRGYEATGINLYMKQHGATEEEAFREFRKRIRVSDKIMVEEFLKTKDVLPRQIVMRLINADRMSAVTYRMGEGYTHPEDNFKHYITSLLDDPIPL
ncbi:PREDICTED: terpenoid synthase 1-like [Tarenaya hassleriana]|uniref:terpenoid synthase 1-like n=1 Tax=Tarenaya hassleriana TaxID=28532 RepID=UPI00053C7C24|nr:PREDICTED: terpenoid synthase 1-like [Tarenaya hassleriana]